MATAEIEAYLVVKIAQHLLTIYDHCNFLQGEQLPFRSEANSNAAMNCGLGKVIPDTVELLFKG